MKHRGRFDSARIDWQHANREARIQGYLSTGPALHPIAGNNLIPGDNGMFRLKQWPNGVLVPWFQSYL
jgi:hypothetical protein